MGGSTISYPRGGAMQGRRAGEALRGKGMKRYVHTAFHRFVAPIPRSCAASYKRRLITIVC